MPGLAREVRWTRRLLSVYSVLRPCGPRKVEPPVGRAGDVSPRTVSVISEIVFNSVSTPLNHVC